MTNNKDHKIRLTREKHKKLIENERELEVWSNFIESIHSEESKNGYTNLLWVYMEFEKCQSYSQLLDRPIENIKTSIKNYFLSLKNRKLSTSYIRYHKAAIKHFYDMNDIENLGWVKLGKFMGEETEMHEDRAYTHEEIARVFDVAHKRLRVCIYLEKSAGLRVGALHTIKYKHLTKKEDCYKIDVYKGTSGNGKYFTFCDPEAAKAIENYLNFRRQCGEIIDDDSPLLRSEFNTNQNKPNHHYNTTVESITRHAVRREMNNYLVQAGLRTVDHENKNNRKEVKATHGFRKFFETQLIRAGIHETLIKRFMGHSNKLLDRRYERLTEDELFEIYKTAIPYLMIDQTAKLEKKVEEQQEQLNEVELLKVKYNHDMPLLLESNKEKERIELLDKQERDQMRQELSDMKQILAKIAESGTPIHLKNNNNQNNQNNNDQVVQVEPINVEYYDASNTDLSLDNYKLEEISDKTRKLIMNNKLPKVSQTHYELTSPQVIKDRKIKDEKRKSEAAAKLKVPKENLREMS